MTTPGVPDPGRIIAPAAYPNDFVKCLKARSTAAGVAARSVPVDARAARTGPPIGRRSVAAFRPAAAAIRTARPAFIAALAIVSIASGAGAQDLEPRAYSAVPIGTNFLLAGYAHTSGSVSTDPALPITGVEASLNTGLLAYDRSFALVGRSASAAVLLPYVWGEVSGEVEEQSRSVSRSGLGDLRLRLASNLIGGPAFTPAEFARREPATTLGASLTIVAPTGQYDSSRLINIGSNRWAFKPEIGLSQPIGDWFVEGAVGAWVYTDNNDFFRGNVRGQSPLWTFQAHGGYNFRPGLWLAADATYYTGGETSLNGVDKNDAQASSRYGLTLSVPVAEGVSVKLAWSTGLTTRVGGNYDTFGLSLQYRWFDR